MNISNGIKIKLAEAIEIVMKRLKTSQKSSSYMSKSNKYYRKYKTSLKYGNRDKD